MSAAGTYAESTPPGKKVLSEMALARVYGDAGSGTLTRPGWSDSEGVKAGRNPTAETDE